MTMRLPDYVKPLLTKQPSAHIAPESITPVANVYSVSGTGYRLFVGAELSMGGTEGYLAVHLVEDPENSWYLMPMFDGTRSGAVFDKFCENGTNGTTVTIAQVTLFLER